MESACARYCAFCMVGDLVDFGGVGLVICGAVWVRVVPHDLVEEVSAVEVAKECEDVFGDFRHLPERRTDALGGLCRFWNLRQREIVVYWYSFSNPRTVCIHYGFSLVGNNLNNTLRTP